MSDLRVRDVPVYLPVAVLCVGLFVLWQAFIDRTGTLPGERPLFQSSGEPFQALPFGVAGWRLVPIDPYSPAGVTTPAARGPYYVAGPTDADGQVVPVRFYQRTQTASSSYDLRPVRIQTDPAGVVRITPAPDGEDSPAVPTVTRPGR